MPVAAAVGAGRLMRRDYRDLSGGRVLTWATLANDFGLVKPDDGFGQGVIAVSAPFFPQALHHAIDPSRGLNLFVENDIGSNEAAGRRLATPTAQNAGGYTDDAGVNPEFLSL